MQKEYFYELLDIRPLTDHPAKIIFQILLKPLGDKIVYQAGQYIEIQYPDGSFQPFSIANAPNAEGTIELLMRFAEKDTVQQAFLNHLKNIQKAALIGPFGHCSSDQFVQKPVLLLSGGVGLSQCKAIIEQLVLEMHKEPLHLYWGIQNPRSLFLEDLLVKWKHQLPQFQYTLVFSEPQIHLDPNQKNGYVHEAVQEDYSTLNHYSVLASGPKEMVFATRNLFRQGLPENKLYSDWFNLL